MMFRFAPYQLGGFGIAMAIIWLIFAVAILVGLIWFIVWAIRQMSRPSTPRTLPAAQGTAGPAAEILQQRYARGEITREQYMQMLEDLKK